MKNLKMVIALGIICFSFIPAAHSYMVFEDHFDGEMSKQWNSVEPVQWVEDGWLHTQDDYAHVGRDSSAFVSDGNKNWKDYTLSLRIDPIPTGSDWENARVFFRTSDIANSYYNVSGNYYILSLVGPYHGGPDDMTSPRIGLSRFSADTDSFDQLFYEESVNYIGSDPMDVDIILSGPRIQVVIDGKKIINLIDPEPLLYGGIGIGAVWEAEARFDDVSVNVVPIPSSFLLLTSGLIFLQVLMPKWLKRILSTHV